MDYKRLLTQVERTLEQIETSDATRTTIEQIAETIATNFREQLGITGGRIYELNDDNCYELAGRFGVSKAGALGIVVPRDYKPIELVRALTAVLRILRQVRDRVGISQSSSVNLFVCDGRNLVATRFTFDFGCWEGQPHEANLRYLSLWYTTGKDYGYHDDEWKMIGGAANADSMLLASEPLTRDISTWVEVPEYSIMYATGKSGYGFVTTVEVDV